MIVDVCELLLDVRFPFFTQKILPLSIFSHLFSSCRLTHLSLELAGLLLRRRRVGFLPDCQTSTSRRFRRTPDEPHVMQRSHKASHSVEFYTVYLLWKSPANSLDILEEYLRERVDPIKCTAHHTNGRANEETVHQTYSCYQMYKTVFRM